MEARELYEIAPSLGISPEERDRIEKAGQGEALLVTTGRRVWVNLYGHTSPGEFAMANTDVLAVDDDDRNSPRRTAMLQRLLRLSRAKAVSRWGLPSRLGAWCRWRSPRSVFVSAGVVIGTRLSAAESVASPDHASCASSTLAPHPARRSSRPKSCRGADQGKRCRMRCISSVVNARSVSVRTLPAIA